MMNKSKKQLEREYLEDKNTEIKKIEERYNIERQEWDDLELGENSPFESIEVFAERELEEWDQNRLQVPAGNYRDDKKVTSDYQQKFVQYTLKNFPEIFDELREFVPFYKSLFGSEEGKYNILIDLFADGIIKINQQLLAENYAYSRSSIFLGLKPSTIDIQHTKYPFHQYEALLIFLYLILTGNDRTQTPDEYTDDLISILQQRVIIRLKIDKNHKIKIPNNLLESNLFENLSELKLIYEKAIKLILVSNSWKNLCDSLSSKFNDHLQKLVPECDVNLVDFIKLQLDLLNWTRRHNIRKDWLIHYAYYFLDEFSGNSAAKIGEIKVPFFYVRALYGPPFKFEFNGWFAGDEKKEDYEKRVVENFEKELKQYFHSVSSMFNLEKRKRVRTTNTKNLDWLTYAIFRKWDAEKIVEKFYPEIAVSRTKNESSALEFENKVKHVRSEIKNLDIFDLPIPKKL